MVAGDGYIRLPFYAGDVACADNCGESVRPPACSRWTVRSLGRALPSPIEWMSLPP